MEKKFCYICKEGKEEGKLTRESRVERGKLIKFNIFYHQPCLDRKRKVGCLRRARKNLERLIH
jgi:hypothetical protein